MGDKSEALQKELAKNKAKGEADSAKGYLFTRLLLG